MQAEARFWRLDKQGRLRQPWPNRIYRSLIGASGRMTYPRNALQKVIVRAEWPEDVNVAEMAGEGLKTVLANLLPTQKTDDVRTFEVQLVGEGASTRQKQTKAYRFLSKDEKHAVMVEPTAVTFEWSQYDSFQEFKQVLDAVLGHLAVPALALPPARTLVLRKVNVFKGAKGSAFDFEGFIHPSLTGATNLSQMRDSMARNVGLIEYRLDEGAIRLRYGWFNPEYPNRIARREFTLDFEYVHNEAVPTSNVVASLATANSQLDTLFEACIQDNLRKWLNGENNL